MTVHEIALWHGVQANLDVGSFGAVNVTVLPDGRVLAIIAVAADEERRHRLHPGDTFQVRDQTWKLDRVEAPDSRDWTIVLARVE